MAWLHHGRETSDATAERPADKSSGLSPLERRTQQIGTDLLGLVRRQSSGPLSARFWSDRLMDWAMGNRAFKAQLFRFVDVFPMLRTSEQVHDCLMDYLDRPDLELPAGMEFGLKAGGMAKGLLARTVANRIKAMAGKFIGGENAAAALPGLEKRWREGMAFSLDLLGEACLSDKEAAEYQARYLNLIDALAERVEHWPANPTLDADPLGPVPRANVSIKISSLSPRADPADFGGSIGRLADALRPILEAASRRNVLVNFDMEQYALKSLTLALFEKCCEQVDFPAGLALQSYLRSGEEDARRLIAWAKQSGRQVTVRLIKGAYWDYEVILAEQQGWPVPVWTAKSDTDACFERMADLLLSAAPRRAEEGGVKLALGSHNVRSIARTLALLEQHELPRAALELQMLRGMAEPLKAAVLEQGLRLREYVPIGEMIPGMAYLVRRLLENTSNESWLRAGFHDDVSDDELLASPHRVKETAGEAEDSAARVRDAFRPEHHRLSPAVEGLADGRPFSNEPLKDFAQPDQRERFAAAVEAAAVPEVTPAKTAADADEAVARAARAFAKWRSVEPMRRSAMLVDAAERMRSRRDELAGIVIREAGKPWREADADVCEAIDFCRYYARQAVELFRPRQAGRFVGELNHDWYEPRGVAAVISPWNFPLAISTGMTAAALVTGNTVIVKPSTQTPGIAKVMCEVFWAAGVPENVLQFLPGSGSVVGKCLVRHPQVALIAFTGSKQVGLEILETAGRVSAGQQFIKKVVCEMGGKNAVIVDDSADPDQAVAGVRSSAFGYSGQKCSAASRAIVLDGIYDVFLKRLVEATRSLVIGDPIDPGTDIGPVIDEHAAEKIRRYIEIGKQEGRLELACAVPPGLEAQVGKPYVGPHIFSGIRPEHRLANEEIFGPVLSVIRVSDFEEAIRVAGGTDYKLTGGVFSRRPSHLELARREFRVGNLYLNRGISGALVARQPFGGFGLSGTGTKAGGPDYLLHFVQPRSCTENTMRHGFAPDLL
jgi:RHH-type proline utilization regulon transcriptional repressor/proline dehydrogenase/delta 1-pyrroline-5-carboxylate dehydrogenase